MIDLNNVVKIYKSKNGSETVALDRVNLHFANKGLVFIVGKSGSGKSTFLNLLGGLDSATSGEIFVSGEDICKFNDKKYDFYRNSYVGFVFQDFNILEQYNVYENIELSLKLQEKIITRSEIDELLKMLDIDGLGERRVNELSGGQKQRVAIARALIKKPKIILADEPTGNLDSLSSEQIFNILKEISREHLVIVVSHDMESALKYGDRVIKFQDGKVVSDSCPIEVLDDEKFELTKSKLPFVYALKMALTSLKGKIGKLIMTIILTTMSLLFMGFMVNCSLFEPERLIVDTMHNNNNYIYIVNYSKYSFNQGFSPLELNKSNIDKIEKISNNDLNVVYELYDDSERLNFIFGENENKFGFYEKNIINFSFVEVKDKKIYGDLIGRSPSKKNEIVVHKYFADYAIKFGIMTFDGTLYFPKSYDDLVNSSKGIKLGNNIVYVVGIIDDDDSLYLDYKNGKNVSDDLINFFTQNYVSKMGNIYVEGFVDSAILGEDKSSILNHMTIKTRNYKYMFSNNISALNKNTNVITSSGLTSLNSLNRGETVISISELKNIDKNFDSSFNNFLFSHPEMKYDDAVLEFCSQYLRENKTLSLFLSINLIEYYEPGSNIILNVVGISTDQYSYISYDYVNSYLPITKRMNSVMIYDNNLRNLRNSLKKMEFVEFAPDLADGNYYNYYVDNGNFLAIIIALYKFLFNYILIISIIFIIFAYLLFSNFISVSISYCKKEIGILRALGASNNDIIKIFGYESLLVGIISWFFSIISWFLVCKLLNNSLFGNQFFILNGFITHPFVPIFMFIFIIFIAIFVMFNSIKKITKVKPIDAILNK